MSKSKHDKRVYVIGSLRSETVPIIAERLRRAGFYVFDDWYAAGPEADDYWQRYEKYRGHSYKQALRGSAARHVFEYDKANLDACDAAVLVLPAGKSAHLEAGYMVGRGKQVIIQLDGEPERFDVMYRFASAVTMSTRETIEVLTCK